MKTTAKFRASRRLRFADTKRMTSPEMSPKSFGTFEKQAPGDKTQGRSLWSFGYLASPMQPILSINHLFRA